MRKYQYILGLTLLTLTFSILGCGQSGLLDPSGVLGGDALGYGRTTSGSGELEGGGYNVADLLIGSWERTTDVGYNIIVTFSRNGQYTVEIEIQGFKETTERGTYQVDISAMEITFNPEYPGNIDSYTEPFSITDNGRTLYLGNYQYSRI
ncbi:MAG: hypothetical protein GXO78_12395 [Calditrichaeota bacterium]|nr:hypothetical protein [Calditrichota bacterium]